MSARADVFIRFNHSERALSVRSVVDFEKPTSSFRFSLSSLLKIDYIKADSNIIWEIVKEWQPQWRYNSYVILVTSEIPVNKITIVYHGNISGWCNVIEEKRIALSSYSSWYITEASEQIKYNFMLQDMEDYFVVNGKFDTQKKLWIYGDDEHDEGNIIALRNGYYHVSKTDNFSFYYLNEAEKVYADNYTYYYEEITRYYKSVFPPKNINKIDIVSLGLDGGGGAYFRNELVVIDTLNVNGDIESIKRNTITLLAHELGHNWFTGANTSSWEDWLNETGAEWSSLLFVLSMSNYKLFEQQIDWPLKKYQETPPIRTPDSKRPDGVHWRGTIMFYEIYKKYGKEVILDILRTLASLDEMTTENFLYKLRIEMGNLIPDIIERGLNLQNYSELFEV